jgi:hypothetical protein
MFGSKITISNLSLKIGLSLIKYILRGSNGHFKNDVNEIMIESNYDVNLKYETNNHFYNNRGYVVFVFM